MLGLSLLAKNPALPFLSFSDTFFFWGGRVVGGDILPLSSTFLRSCTMARMHTQQEMYAEEGVNVDEQNGKEKLWDV